MQLTQPKADPSKPYIMQSIFERFRIQSSGLTEIKKQPTVDIRFLLDADAEGVFVTTTDKHLKEIDPNYAPFHGLTREILKLLFEIRIQDGLRFHWDRSEDRCYLKDYPYLTSLLVRSDLVVNRKNDRIKRVEGVHHLALDIDGERLLTAELSLSADDRSVSQFTMLNGQYILCDSSIYEVASVGPAFSDVHLLNCRIKQNELNVFLSLMFSHFENINVAYHSYDVVYHDPKRAVPCIVFSEIDENDFLHVKLSHCLYDFSPDFFTSYDIKYVAMVEDSEECISVHPLTVDPDGKDFAEIFGVLRELQKQLRTKKSLVQRR